MFLEFEKIDYNKVFRFYILSLVFIFIESSVLIKYLNFLSFTPNILLILIIIYSFKYSFNEAVKFSVFIGIFKNLLNPQDILVDIPLYIFYVGFLNFFKGKIEFSNYLIKTILSFIVFLLNYLIRSLILYLEVGQLIIDKYFILYAIINSSIFFLLDRFIFNK